MATIAELCDNELLVRIDVDLGPREQPSRILVALPHVIDWLDGTLPGLESDFTEGRTTPIEQVDELFYEFVAGVDLAYYERTHSMNPSHHGIWELKTADVRFFGWFVSRSVFVMAEVDTAYRCKHHSLYAGYRDSAARRRNNLDLNEPKFIEGSYEDVL